jgi:ParB-like chromosome segregation protein Spo0J
MLFTYHEECIMCDESRAKAENERVQKCVIAELTTAGVETRCCLRQEAVDEFAGRIRAGEEMDPAVVYLDDGGKLYVAAGHHRKAAYAKAGEVRMPCVVRRGSQWDAIKFGIEDNQQHRGVRLSLEDKRHNVKQVLEQQPGMSDSAIASLCGVSPTTVGKYRGTLPNGKVTERIGRDGKTYDTCNLGRRPAELREPAQSPAMTGGNAAPTAVVRDEGAVAVSAQAPAEPAAEAGPASVESVCPDEKPVVVTGQPSGDATSPPALAAVEGHAPDEPKADAKPGQEGDDGTDDLPPINEPSDSGELGEVRYKEAVKRLGRTKSAIDALARSWPGPNHRATLDHLGRAGQKLSRWKKEQAECK